MIKFAAVKLAAIAFCLALATLISAEAAQYKGFPETKETGMKTYTLNESVIRFTETQKEFLILLDKHSAFYRFPKKADMAIDFRSFLNKRIQSKAKIRFIVNPRSTEILKVHD